MNFNLVEMYNGLLRFNKHILNELAEGLKHLPNLEGASKGDSLYINEDGNPTWGSSAFIPTFENAAYGIEWTKNDNDVIRIGNAKFHRELPIQNRLKGCVYNEKKISYFLNPTGWAKPLEICFLFLFFSILLLQQFIIILFKVIFLRMIDLNNVLERRLKIKIF